MSKKPRINTKKIKKENKSEISKLENSLDSDINFGEEDNIRPPIDSYFEQLLPSDHLFSFSDEDHELKLALELSAKEFYQQNSLDIERRINGCNSLQKTPINSLDNKYEKMAINNENLKQDRIEQESIDQERIEQERIDQERIDQDRIDQERIDQERIEQESIEQERIDQERIEQERIDQERIDQERIKQESIDQERIEQDRIEQDRIEQDRIEQEKNNRIISLQNFCNRIQRLTFVKEDKKIKELVENALNNYFNLTIDNIKIKKKDYEYLFKIVDSYYLIPSSKNIKTAITKEENNLIKNIFLLDK